jgi:hypothetical protein
MLKDVRMGQINQNKINKKSQVTTNQLLTISTKNIFINKLKLFLNIHIL